MFQLSIQISPGNRNQIENYFVMSNWVLNYVPVTVQFLWAQISRKQLFD